MHCIAVMFSSASLLMLLLLQQMAVFAPMELVQGAQLTCAYDTPSARTAEEGAFVVIDGDPPGDGAVVFAGVFDDSEGSGAVFEGYRYCVEQTNLCDGGVLIGGQRVPLVMEARMTSLFDAVEMSDGVPHFRREVCEEPTDWEIAEDNTISANRLARDVEDQNFEKFARASVRVKIYEAKFDELISRSYPRVHALLGDRTRYPPLLAQSNAGNIVFTAPDFQISSVGVKCMDDIDRHFHFGWIDMLREGEREATFHEDLCGEDELFMNELRRSGVRRLAIIHNSNKILSTVC